tara:strand:- start:20136 stop:20876 length:741 start_codon:yes stop_codon:yes gene_type:complete
MLNLKNKICVVTGCHGYVGKIIVKKLYALGVKVIGTDIVEKRNKRLKYFYKLDLSKKRDIESFAKIIDRKFKKIDILVNNASYVGTSNINKNNFGKTFYNEKFERLNLTNTIYFTNLILKNLQKSKSSSIINISSIYSLLGFDYNLYKGTNMKTPLAYGISKAGLSHFSKMLSSALPPNIRINSISPGGIFRKQPKKFIRKYLKKIPLKRMCTEEDVANAVVFFSSDLSNYITGQNLIIDGGYSAS